MSDDKWSVLNLRVVAEPDPAVLGQVIQRFANLNIMPVRMLAEWATTGILHVDVRVAGVSEAVLDIIAAKLGSVPCIRTVYWYR